MSLLGDIVGIFTSHKADKKTNALNKAQLDLQQKGLDRQIEISKYIEELAKQVAGTHYGYTDAFGGGVTYDPATGTYKTTLNPQEKAIEEQS